MMALVVPSVIVSLAPWLRYACQIAVLLSRRACGARPCACARVVVPMALVLLCGAR